MPFFNFQIYHSNFVMINLEIEKWHLHNMSANAINIYGIRQRMDLHHISIRNVALTRHPVISMSF